MRSLSLKFKQSPADTLPIFDSEIARVANYDALILTRLVLRFERSSPQHTQNHPTSLRNGNVRVDMKILSLHRKE